MASVASPTLESCSVTMPAHAPRARLALSDGPGAPAEWKLTEPLTIIGWGGASTLQLPDKSMSKMQCLLVHTGAHLLLCDLHSPNPTLLNDRQTSCAALSDGDRISIGKATLTVHIEPAGPDQPDPHQDPLKLPGKLLLEDTVSPETAVLEKAITLLGRRETLDICLEDPAVSPAHAVIFAFGNQPMIRDLSGRSGFLVNGEQRDFSVLREGDLLHVGPFEVRLRLSGWPKPSPPPAPAPPPQDGAPQPEPQAAPQPAPSRPEPSSSRPEDLGGLDQLRRKVSQLWEDLLAYRDRLGAWERDLTTLAEELAAKPLSPTLPPRPPIPAPHEPSDQPAGSAPPPPPNEALGEGPEQALECFCETLDAAQSVLESAPAADQAPDHAPAAGGDAEASSSGTEPEAVATGDAAHGPDPADQDPALRAQPEASPDTDPSGSKHEDPADDPGPECSSAPEPTDAPADQLPEARPAEQRPAPCVNSLDLDPEVADQLRLMRRLNPEISDGDLLDQILAEGGEADAKPAGKKPSWWSRK